MILTSGKLTSTYLVTGGCGFIGSHLVDRLVSFGVKVRILDNFSTGRLENINHSQVEIIEGDITSQGTLKKAMQGIDGCFHLAALASVELCNSKWLYTHNINQSGTISVFDNAVSNGSNIPIVYASSAAVYGNSKDCSLSEESIPSPLSSYGVDKFGCEMHAKVGAIAHGLRSIGLRFFNVYGPRQNSDSPYSGVISIFAERIRSNRELVIYGDGLQSRDFIYVSDVVGALIKAMDRLHVFNDSISDVINVCTGKPTTLLYLLERICKVANVDHLKVTHQNARQSDIRRSLGDVTKLEKTLNISSYISLDEGLNLLLNPYSQGSDINSQI